MERGHIQLQNPERFQGTHTIPTEKIQAAIQKAAAKLEKRIDEHGTLFPGTCSKDFRYTFGENNNWECGMQTGAYLMAWELTGNEKFLNAFKEQVKTYRTRFDNKVSMNDHDVGFAFTPSCVAAYKVLGDEDALQTALDAAEYFYDVSYSKKGGFILRYGLDAQAEWACRTMMDTLMNIPFLFWVGQKTGVQKYVDAAKSQVAVTDNCLIRENGSSFHHYQFDVETHAPVKGITFQGNADDSTWSRGHSWGVYGFPIAYKYTKDAHLIDLHRDVAYYLLNHLPADGIVKWDLDFVEGDAAQDSSAGIISACGMDEMSKNLPDNAPQKAIFQNAFAQILEATIDHCTGDIGVDYDGLICHVTHAHPFNQGIDECAMYGDFFYLEALLRYTKPDWKPYW